MMKTLAPGAFALTMLVSFAASAAEQTVTLAIKNMYCAAYPLTVKASLQAVPGVSKVICVLPGQDRRRDLRQHQGGRAGSDHRNDQRGLSFDTQGLTGRGAIKVRETRHDQSIHDHLSEMWDREDGNDADRRLLVLLRMHRLWRETKAEAR